MVKKVTFVGFRGHDPTPLDPPLIRFLFLDLTCLIVKNVLSHPYVLQNTECILPA